MRSVRCVKCGWDYRPARKSRVAHLLCPKCRRPVARPTGSKTHIPCGESLRNFEARPSARAVLKTLCGRQLEKVSVAPEGSATCQRCQGLLLVRRQNLAYRKALKASAELVEIATRHHEGSLVGEALKQISEELKFRAEGKIRPARMVGPEILRRARNR